ncbi:SPX domain-containing protein [Chlamydoabsidia padenii]|nr:SPX domain-containing protein [Chlamydoabsidia padenii]
MKFAKQLETESESIPSEWRPYLIQYKKLKKLITKVADEIEKHGMSVSMLHDCLDNSSSVDPDSDMDAPQVQYYFTGEAPNIRPCIRFTYDTNNNNVMELLSGLINEQQQAAMDSKGTRSPLEYQRSQDNTDFFTLTHDDMDYFTPPHRHRRDSAAQVIRDLTELTLHKDGNKRGEQVRSLVIELEQDDEFFYMLMTELQSAVRLQHKTSDRFQSDINELEKRMVQVASPNQKSDMYAWRQIFSLYMDAQIFQGKLETDRSIHSVQKAREQMLWFTNQVQQENLVSKMKNRVSKSALQQFMALNTELITMKHYQALNQTAMTKILKKHDKRSGLTASTSFPDFVGSNEFFTPKLGKLLCAAIIEKLTTIIPQPDDYSCPVCMNVAWRPIRLVCGHVFCVRCLIKAQKKNMTSCPMCRHPTAVETASALNLDEPMQNFLLMYFPKEIKQKKRDNEREQAIEDVEAFTGRTYSPEQIARMSRDNHHNCIIM